MWTLQPIATIQFVNVRSQLVAVGVAAAALALGALAVAVTRNDSNTTFAGPAI
jgi:hypothetical protein